MGRAMSEVKQFRLPDVGEGLTEADIVTWRVKPGDRVTVNQVIVEIETAKAVVELPSPYEGVVTGLLVSEGQTVDVGTPIIEVDVAEDAGTAETVPAGSGTAGSGTAGSGTAGSGTARRRAPTRHRRTSSPRLPAKASPDPRNAARPRRKNARRCWSATESD